MRRANAGGLDEILVRDGQSVEHADCAAARHRLVGFGCIGRRALGDERETALVGRIVALRVAQNAALAAAARARRRR